MKYNKKLVIDSRYINLSGLGTFCKGILDYLSVNDNFSITLLGDKKALSKLFPKIEIIDNISNPFSKNGLFLSKKVLAIINNNYAFFSPGYIIPFGIKIPIYTTIHDCVFFDEPSSCKNLIDKEIKRLFYIRAINHSQKIFTVSSFSKSRIVANFRCDDKKIKIVTSGLSKDIIEFKQKMGNIRKENYFVFVGNFKPYKGIDVLLDAFRLYKEKGGKNSLYLIGNKKGLNTSISIKKCETPGVFFKEGISNNELFSLMSSAQALVLPSKYEGFGLPPFEAMYLGTVSILNDIPVLHEIYDGSGAIFYKRNDAISLCETMLDIDFNPVLHLSNCLKKYSFKASAEIIKTEIGI